MLKICLCFVILVGFSNHGVNGADIQHSQFSEKYNAGDPLTDPNSDDPNFAAEYCRTCLEARNHKDYYVDPNNCTRFYHCIDNGTVGGIIGIARPCPAGQRFHAMILSCVPRWEEADSAVCLPDRCEELDTFYNGYWQEDGVCGTYFRCSNFYSVKMCCPAGQRFDMAVAENPDSDNCCVRDSTCNDHPAFCSATPSPRVLQVVLEGANRCINEALEFPLKLQTHEVFDYKYYVVHEENHPQPLEEMLCAPNTKFVLEDCECSKLEAWVDVVLPVEDKCILDIRFDNSTTIVDSSPQKLWIDNKQDPEVKTVPNDKLTVDPEFGVGLFDGTGHLEVPGTQNILMRTYTIDFWIKSECLPYDDFQDNERQTIFTYGEQNTLTGTIACYREKRGGPGNTIEFIVCELVQPDVASTVNVVEVASDCGTWVHFALTYDIENFEIRFFKDCVEQSGSPIDLSEGGIKDKSSFVTRRWRKCPLIIGYGAEGYFTGRIDAFRVCKEAKTAAEICDRIDETRPFTLS